MIEEDYTQVSPLIDRVETPQSRRGMIIQRICALVCVLFAVLDWVVLAEILQKLESRYNKPLFLCFCIKCTYCISFIPYILWKFTPLGGEGRYDTEPFSVKYMFTRGCILNILGFISGYAWYMSLPITSVSGNTAVYMCACAAVFLISIPVLREKVTVINVLALLTCCTGIILVSMFPNSGAADDGAKSKDSVLGYVLVLISMFLYATYEVFYGKLLQTDQDKHPAMTSLKLVGFLGLTTPCLFGIALPIWHFAGWERFELVPRDLLGWYLLILLLDALFNIFLLLAIALSNPTLASVGQSLALPTSMVADYFINHFMLPVPALIGAGCVFMGFCGFVYEELKHKSEPEPDLGGVTQSLLETTSESEGEEKVKVKQIN